MTLPKSLEKLAIPLVVLVTAALVAMTVTSPDPESQDAVASESGESTGATANNGVPPQPSPPDKELVPVRGDAPADDPEEGQAVGLRLLVIAASSDDHGLSAWQEILDGIGSPYDVLFADTDTVEADQLVRADDVGRYSAILLTSNDLFVDNQGEGATGLDPTEWAALGEYARTFDVRQVVLDAAPEQLPENYCLREGAEENVESDPISVEPTTLGSEIFDYLDRDVDIPLANSYVYRPELETNCEAEPILTDGSDVLGVLSTAPDGRERMALTFSLSEEEPSTSMIGYGVVRWATKGVFVGERRHWLNVDVDDWFTSTLRRHPDGSSDEYRIAGPEVPEIRQQQVDLREEHPLASEFVLNLPYNGGAFDVTAPAECTSTDTPDPLSSYSLCLHEEFRWINHTLSHPQMNTISYGESYSEIKDNLDLAAEAGMTVPTTILKTPEYSGLGVYNPDGSTESPTDFGLEGSNEELLKAASDLDVDVLHGNMSFDSHQPDCFNCGIYHPLQSDVFIVPDWPTNIAYEATTPEQEEFVYNSLYGEDGDGERDLSYEEIIDAESDIALGQLISGSAYAHTLHQGNLHQYDEGKSLTFDWLDAVLTKYGSYYTLPIKTPDWVQLAEYVRQRNAHFDELDHGSDVIWNRATDAIIYTGEEENSLFVTGLETRQATNQDQSSPDEAEEYGSDSISRIGVKGDETVTLRARPTS